MTVTVAAAIIMPVLAVSGFSTGQPRACPGHPRLLMPESEDVDARIKSAQDDFKLLRIKPRHAKVVEALSLKLLDSLLVGTLAGKVNACIFSAEAGRRAPLAVGAIRRLAL